jgi:hypothetical protein
MAPVIVLRVDAVQVPHHPRQVALRGLEEQVIVVLQEAIGKDPDAPHLMTVAEKLEEPQPVNAIGEDPLAGQAAVHDVVVGTRELNAERTGHEGTLERKAR